MWVAVGGVRGEDSMGAVDEGGVVWRGPGRAVVGGADVRHEGAVI